MTSSFHAVRALLGRAEQSLPPGKAPALGVAMRRMEEPLRVAIAGKIKAGKSTLLNALVGEPLAPTDAGECTRIVTWYQNGLTYKVTARTVDGDARELPFERGEGSIEPQLGRLRADDVAKLTVEWPSSRLERMTLIDTPGIDSISSDVSARTHEFLEHDEDEPSAVDAVIYLMRHTHSSDLRFLEAFHGEELAHPSPLNAIGVLSRADELGVCRPTAMQSAQRIATRYRTDPQLRRLCQTIVPVAGLVAQAGSMLTEEQFKLLAALAQAPTADTDRLLLTVDRFVDDATPGPITAAQRQDLMQTLGIYGVRVSVSLLRIGVASTSSELAAELLRRSGIEDLREALLNHFSTRAELLKARSAIATLRQVLATEDVPDKDDLATELERITSQAHEFAELRLIDALRNGGIALGDDELVELERLLGGFGGSDHVRLGVEAELPHEEVTVIVLETLTRWQNRAEHPLTDRETADAARVAVRTCEGMYARLRPQPDKSTVEIGGAPGR